MGFLECIISDVVPCQLNDNAESVSLRMWEHQFEGFPIVDNKQSVIGVVTDSDISKCSVIKHKPIWELTISEIYKHRYFYTCYHDDDIKTALNILIKNHLQWLSVINRQQQFIGVIRLADIMTKVPIQTNVIQFNTALANKKLKNAENFKTKTCS